MGPRQQQGLPVSRRSFIFHCFFFLLNFTSRVLSFGSSINWGYHLVKSSDTCGTLECSVRRFCVKVKKYVMNIGEVFEDCKNLWCEVSSHCSTERRHFPLPVFLISDSPIRRLPHRCPREGPPKGKKKL